MKKIKNPDFMGLNSVPWFLKLLDVFDLFMDNIVEYRALVRSQMVENLAMEVRKGGKIRQKTNN